MLKKIKTIKILLGTILCCSLIVCSSCGKGGKGGKAVEKGLKKVEKAWEEDGWKEEYKNAKKVHRINKVNEISDEVRHACRTCYGTGQVYYVDAYGNQVSDLVNCPDCGGTGRR